MLSSRLRSLGLGARPLEREVIEVHEGKGLPAFRGLAGQRFTRNGCAASPRRAGTDAGQLSPLRGDLAAAGRQSDRGWTALGSGHHNVVSLARFRRAQRS